MTHEPNLPDNDQVSLNSTTHYCTYFDHRFSSLGLALYGSLQRFSQPFCLWVLCLSAECYVRLSSLDLPNLIPVPLEKIELTDPELLACKHNRPIIEYYYTCGPAFMTWLFRTQPDIEILTYLDADLFFFRDPRFLLSEFVEHSILIVPHNYSPRNQHLSSITGIYNVGWVSFRRDLQGLLCLQWWRLRCIESCARTGGLCGDQMYLDEFPRKFSRVYICKHSGVDVAPWNLDNFKVSVGKDGEPFVNDQYVIFFHFSELRRLAPFLWRAPYRNFSVKLTRAARLALFAPYLAEVVKAEKITGYELPAPSLKQGSSLFRRNRLLGIMREILALFIRGGGIWIVGRHVL